MLNMFILAVWIGGIGPSYTACRKHADKGRFTSAIDAFVWPMGIAPLIVKCLFDPKT